MTTYAVVETGGKQYRLSPGDVIDVEKLPTQVGGVLDLIDVRLVAHEGQLYAGDEQLRGAKVVAEVLDAFVGPKLVIMKYRPKKNYRRKRGHRQWYTRLLVKSIIVPGVFEVQAAPRAEAPELKEPVAEEKPAEEPAVPAQPAQEQGQEPVVSPEPSGDKQGE